jgi:uncharacterized damage-inducible protein DinB
MQYDIHKSAQILSRTPAVLYTLLKGLDETWTSPNEGPDTWSAYDVIGHLIHGEKTDWIPRMEIILSDKDDKSFEPFDRFAMFNDSGDKTLAQLLEEFSDLRERNIQILLLKNITEADLEKKGVHPVFGEVTLAQLLATWTVHDLNHIGQIARVMAKQYKEEVGPWTEFLGILKKAEGQNGEKAEG